MWKSNFNVEIHKAQAYGNLRLPLPLTRRYLIVGRCQWLCLLKKLSSCGGGRDLSELEERGSWAWRRKNWFFGFLSVWVGEGTVAPGVALHTVPAVQGSDGTSRAHPEGRGLPLRPWHSQRGHYLLDPARSAPNLTRPRWSARTFTLEVCCLEDGVSGHPFHVLVCLITTRVIINDPEHHHRVLSISFNTRKVGRFVVLLSRFWVGFFLITPQGDAFHRVNTPRVQPVTTTESRRAAAEAPSQT